MHTADWSKIKEIFHQALDLPESERDALLSELEEPVRREVGELIAAHQNASNFISESAPVALGIGVQTLVGTSIGGYEILADIGAGGMGTVFLAKKDGLDKRVALKIIKRGMDTDAVLRRFILEREILSRLEHPNIARFLDGGTTEDGLPYFVMEYIEGEPITRYCGLLDLDINERLKLFRQVCSAVSYAHRNLIVHRDLKPSNILITKDGTPKLLDFGIAKLLAGEGNEETATATQGRMFTPEYASPEQLNGSPITTSSDVYSLGVVLYEMVSGRRPFQAAGRNSGSAGGRASIEEPARPSSVVADAWPVVRRTSANARSATGEIKPGSSIRGRHSLRGDLDNIVLKSLRAEPERRYQSVQEFAADIDRLLDGLPVTATPDRAFYRLSKFVRRNRFGTAIAALIVLLSGFSVWQAVVATRERSRAQARFEQVRKLARAMLFDYEDKIKDLPGTTEVRRQIVTDALEYLDNLAAQGENPPELQREIALAYQKVAQIQSSRGGANIGDASAAFENLQKAVKMQEALVSLNTAEVLNDKSTLAGLYLDLSDRYSVNGDLENQEAFARLALKLREELASADPAEPALRSKIASAKWAVAFAVRMRGDYDAANELFLETAEIYEKLAADDDNGRTTHLRNAALTYKTYGAGLEAKDDIATALEYYRKALAIDEKNAAADSLNVAGQLDLSFTTSSIANALKKQGSFSEALRFIERSLEIQLKITTDDAANLFARAAFVRSLTAKAAILAELGKTAEAEADFKRSVELAEKISGADPQDADKKSLLSRTYGAIGEFYSRPVNSQTNPARPQNLRLSETYLVKGIAILEEMQSRKPLKRSSLDDLERLRKELLEVRSKLGN